MIQAIEKRHNINLINERIEALKKFKEEVSVHSLTYAKFEAEQQPRLKNVQVFQKGLKFYNNLNVQIIQELQSEIQRTEKEAENIQKVKEAQMKHIQSLF